MDWKRAVLAGLLGVSALLNVVALAKLSRSPEPRPPERTEVSNPESSPRTAASLREELTAVRARNAKVLRERVEEASRLPAPAAPSPRRAIRKGIAGMTDLMRYRGLMSLPSSDPAQYAALMHGMYENALDEAGVPLTDDQQRQLEQNSGSVAQGAQQFVATADRLTWEYQNRYGRSPRPRGVSNRGAGANDPYEAVHFLEYRAQLMRAQVEALESVSGLTQEQRERLATEALRNYIFR
ncbi:MAG: hypothetical protein HY716_13870 [Planctomycetes bacterium]|nr:hypothetical protein [Planctomycetota bacterium]